jgi:putative CocE/NonD family hydrolase
LKLPVLALICLIANPFVSAQQLDFPNVAISDDVRVSESMSALAEQVISVYKDSDRDRYLNNLFQLQMVAGKYAEADATINSLRDLRRTSNAAEAAARLAPFDIYAKAKAKQAASRLSFDDAFKQSFRDAYDQLDDKTALRELFWFGANLDWALDDLRKTLERQKGKDGIATADALDLIRKYHFYQVFKSILPLMDALEVEDDTRRYIIEDNVLIKTPDGASIAAIVVRPRVAGARLTTLLGFTIYANDNWSLADAKTTAANGYAGVVAYTRGKGRSPDVPVPYVHDGDDARAVIDWISKQPWGDGRVGMYGGSYNGFTQWAAAKHVPPALKAMMPSVAVAPGIDVPMEGNIFLNFMYPWPLYTTSGHLMDEANYNDRERWNRLNRTWYTSGQAYRSLERIDGTPNPFFDGWLNHPSYDAYWQSLIPNEQEFANINIPILATDGYLGGQALSSPYYFTEHFKYNPHAEHYYLVGPYDHIGAQRQSQDVLNGYQIDPVARINIEELRYQWFDYVFKGGPKPELLKDKVNYEVMGANEWKHAPSLDGMSNGSLRFHLTAARDGDAYRLNEMKPSKDAFIRQRVDFADRSDVNRVASDLIVGKTLDTSNGIAFVSDPIPQPTEVSGVFSGELDFITNKKDMDVKVVLYELMPNGDYFRLSYYMARASYAKDRSYRQLLTADQRQKLAFTSERVTSRRFQSGSRLVVVLSINKQADVQINYGTGKDVSDESIADARVPMQIKWFNDSFVEIPVWK